MFFTVLVEGLFIGKKGDLTGMAVGARLSGRSILETGDLQGFSPSLDFTETGLKKRKYQVRGSCVDEKGLLMSEVRGEWAD